jgi:hypothetical protein
MRRTCLMSVLWLPALTVAQVDLLQNPFTAPVKPQPVPVPAVKKPPVAAPAPPRVQPVPLGLRAILISERGVGVLSTPDGVTFPVVNGKTVRINEQDYFAELSGDEIKLYSSFKGRLLWSGRIGGSTLLTEPADASQLKYTPPLSAGVSPGLQSGTASSAPAAGTR